MYILFGQAELFFPYSSSLKEKRMVVQSVIMRVRKRFNISICEVDHHNLWQRSTLGFTAVCNSFSEAEPFVSAIRDSIEKHEDACEITLFHYDVCNHKPGDTMGFV